MEQGEWIPITHSAHRYRATFSGYATKNIDQITASQYDIVLNGYEIGGGSIRSHRPDDL